MGFIAKSALSAAALSMAVGGALPAMAATTSHNVYKANAYEQSSEYRRGGWGRHRDDGVSTGDVLTGIGILAGIAILASAASKKDNPPPPPPPESYPDDYGYDAAPAPSRGDNDIGSAVNACSVAAERSAGGDARVDEIRSATRDGNGWRVEGSLSNADAQGFICGANGGNVDFVQLQS